MYDKYTLPYINSIPVASTEWVRDILEGKRETKHVIVNDEHEENGFVTLLDSKWKSHPNVDKVAKSEWKTHPGVQTSLYLLGIARDGSIRSVRDLRGHHIPMLQNLMDSSVAAIEEIYGLQRNKLRIFCHYLPQYWHFHVHFTCLADFGMNIGKAMLVEDIIQNLKMNGNYYRDANLSCVVYDGDALLTH